VDVLRGEWDFGEEVIVACFVIGFLTIERDCTLVGEKDFPKGMSEDCK